MSSTVSFTLRLRSRSLVPASPTICVIFFLVRMSTRTPSPSKLEIGRMVDVSLHHRGVHAHAAAFGQAMALCPIVLASGVFAPPTRVKSRYTRLARTSRSSTP